MEARKSPKHLLILVLIVLVCAAGFFVTSHLTGSFALDSADDLTAVLQQAVLSEQPPAVHKTDLTDDCLAVLFDAGDGQNDLVLLVPDLLFSSRWCYLDAAQTDQPVGLYHTPVRAGEQTLVVVFGRSDRDVTVTAGETTQTVSPDEDGIILEQFRVAGTVTPVLND